MNFQRGRGRDAPDINLIPLIDVLLVILIFVMTTTTFSRFAGLEINLPTADAQQEQKDNKEIDVLVTASGQIMINRSPLASADVAAIAEGLRRAAGAQVEPVVVINADAKAAHQSVIDVMQAAQTAGYPRISFATQAAK